MNSKQQRAFSLVELMVVVGAIGILAALAMASYSKYVMRARVSALINSAASVQVQVEQYFTQNSTLLNFNPSYNTFADPTLVGKLEVQNSIIVIVGTPLVNQIQIALVPVIQYVPSTTTITGITWTCRTPSNFFPYVPALCKNACVFGNCLWG